MIGQGTEGDMKTGERRDFDKEAAQWDEKPQRLKLAQDVADAIVKTVDLSKKMDVLDFGCGTGLVTLLLQPHVGNIVGADSLIRTGNGSPVWLADNRISAVSANSIDRATVDMNSGEMSFEIFDYSSEVDSLIAANIDKFNKLRTLSSKLGTRCLPEFLIQYIERFSPQGELSLAIHSTASIDGYGDADRERIERKKGLIGKSDREETKYPHALHHIKIYRNSKEKARVFYKYVGSITFLKKWK
jgi:SAM-dependent methyltransferase